MTLPVNHDATRYNGSTSRARLLSMLNASWMTQAAAVAVQLRLPELLAGGPLPASKLAQAADCHEPSLLRLLRALTSLDLLAEQPGDSFALTELGTLLRADASGSLAAWAVLCGTSSWTAWSKLADSVRTGQSARKLMRGSDGFDHLENDPEAALVFNRAMVDLTQPIAAAVLGAVDFTDVRQIVDVGGGVGELLATIVAAYPRMRGVLFDLAHVSRTATDLLARAGVSDRCELVTGSFFDEVPHGADAYLLKSVLHDWDDERCATILRQCRLAMPAQARLLIIERMMPSRYSCSPTDQGIARSDLNMLVGPGGRERTESEYRAMLDAVGMKTIRVQGLTDSYSVLEAVPA